MFGKEKHNQKAKAEQETGAAEHKDTVKTADNGMLQISEKEFVEMQKELEDDKKKITELNDRYLRLQADFDNAKKRMQREQQEFVKYANEGVILGLLGILDDLERSVDAATTKHEDSEAFLKGIEMILAHVYELLKQHNVRPIEAEGKVFDPTRHEALMVVESDKHPEHTILEELQKGYMLGDRVIRTAKVKVAKALQKDNAKNVEVKEGKEKKSNEGTT